MRLVLLLPLVLGFCTAALVTMTSFPARTVLAKDNPLEIPQTTDLLLDIEYYEDDDYGFSVAIPAGWQKVVAVQSEENFGILEPGYTVGFEAPKYGEMDLFADYIMIEILPGNDSGAFETDGSNRIEVSIDGSPGWIDMLDIKATETGLKDVELTIYQAQISGLGYTVGLYAIGEPDRGELMSTAFKLLVRTFGFLVEPYSTA